MTAWQEYTTKENCFMEIISNIVENTMHIYTPASQSESDVL